MTGWIAETLLSVTILLAAVLLLRRPVARLFGAGWAYALWLVPALRLVLPPMPLFIPEITLPPAAAIIPAAVDGTAPLPAEAGPGQWLPMILAIWAGGAAFFLYGQWRAYRAFRARVEADARPARPDRYGGIRTMLSGAVDGPLAMGLVSRRIVLPADFTERYNPVERRLALDHELTHHRRGDILWNLAAVFILALNWFNPVAWIAFRAFRADQELACDAAVVASAVSLDERCDYARALVKSASRPGLIAACALNSAAQLKRRLRMMRVHRSSGVRRVGGVAVFLAIAGGGFAVGLPVFVEQVDARPQAAAAVVAPAPVKVAAATSTPAPAVAAAPRPRKAAKPKRRSAVLPLPAAAPAAPELPPVPMVEIETVHAAPAAPAPRATRFVMVTQVRASSPEAARAAIERAILFHRERNFEAHRRAAAIRLVEAPEALRRLQLKIKAVEEGGK